MLEIRLLGKFEIVQDGAAVELPFRAAQSLLAWLVLHPNVDHRRERLAGLLWPESVEENALGNLRRALWQLRRALPNAPLSADRLAIRWQTNGSTGCDVDGLLRAENGEQSVEALAAALRVYGGELLPGFYDEWVTLQRERLAALYAMGIARLLDMLTVVTRWSEVVEWAERWIAQGGAPEPAYRALMSAHAGLGNLPSALAAYQRCVEALRSELDVTPSAETEQLYTDIRSGIRNSQFTVHPFDRLRTLHSQFSTSSPKSLPQSNIPAQTTPLVGRQEELSALAELLSDPQHRLVTIVGPGGMGKSRLALAAAAAQIERFADGVFFVPLTEAEQTEAIAPAIAAALGFALQDERRPPQQQLLDYLRQRALLLVLDNFEHLLTATPLLVAILESAPAVKLLVTSRERLRLRAETLLPLGGLGLPPPGVDVAASDAYSAVDLFTQSAQRLQRSFTPHRTIAAITRICRLAEGMPLGILLAASWIDVLTPEEIAAEIERTLDFLAADLRDLPARQRSLRAIFEQSWQRLPAKEQSILVRLALFVGDFEREAAELVVDASLSVLSELAAHSLIQRRADGRFHLHELLRRFAGEKLQASGQAEATSDRHCAYYANLISGLNTQRQEDKRRVALQAFAADEANLLAAWQWATTTGHAQRLEQMNEGLAAYFLKNGRYIEGESLYTSALNSLANDATALRPRIRLALQLAHFYIQHGEWESARRALEQAEHLLHSPLLEEDEMLRERGLVLNWQGHLTGGGNPILAQQKFSQALSFLRASGDDHWTVRVLLALGWSARQTGDYDRLRDLMDEALVLCRDNQDFGALASALEHLAFAAIEQGRMVEAEEYTLEGLAAREREGNAGGIARAWRNLGVLLLLQGRFAEAESRLAEATARYASQGEESGLLFTTIWQGMAQLHQGDYAQARRYGEKGLEQARLAGHQGIVANGLLLLGSIALAEKDAAALALLNESVEKYRSRNQKHELAISLCTLAYAQYRADGNAPALTTIRHGLEIVTALAFFPRAVAAPLLALLLRAEGKTELAVELHAFALTYPYIANSRWFYDVAGKELEALAASLPPDALAAAQARGRARDLQATTAELLEMLNA